MAPPSKPSSSGGNQTNRQIRQNPQYDITGSSSRYTREETPNDERRPLSSQQTSRGQQSASFQPPRDQRSDFQSQPRQPDVRYRPRPIENSERPVTQDSSSGDTVDGVRVHTSHLNLSYSQHQVESSSPEDVRNSTPGLFTSFVIDRMESEGYDIPPSFSRREDKESEVARHLRRIGDDIARDKQLNRLIGEIKVTPSTVYETFYSVASQIFEDGTIHWGRIVMLFYFAFKLSVQVVSQGALIDKIIEWVTRYVADKLASWIANRGGWTSIREYYGSTTPQLVGVFFAGILLSSLFWYFKK